MVSTETSIVIGIVVVVLVGCLVLIILTPIILACVFLIVYLYLRKRARVPVHSATQITQRIPSERTSKEKKKRDSSTSETEIVGNETSTSINTNEPTEISSSSFSTPIESFGKCSSANSDSESKYISTSDQIDGKETSGNSIFDKESERIVVTSVTKVQTLGFGTEEKDDERMELEKNQREVEERQVLQREEKERKRRKEEILRKEKEEEKLKELREKEEEEEILRKKIKEEQIIKDQQEKEEEERREREEEKEATLRRKKEEEERLRKMKEEQEQRLKLREKEEEEARLYRKKVDEVERIQKEAKLQKEEEKRLRIEKEREEEETARLPRKSAMEIHKTEYKEIDANVVKILETFKKENSMGVEELYNLLLEDLEKEELKMRALFRFCCGVLKYDKSVGNENDLLSILRSGKGKCSTYSFVFKKFCDMAGLKCKIIGGYSKGAGYEVGTIPDIDHDWNIVEINGVQGFIDSTWGAGASIHGVWELQFTPFWWFTPPEIFIFSHFPPKDEDQLLEETVKFDDFVDRVRTYSSIFLLKQFPYNGTWTIKDSNVLVIAGIEVVDESIFIKSVPNTDRISSLENYRGNRLYDVILCIHDDCDLSREYLVDIFGGKVSDFTSSIMMTYRIVFEKNSDQQLQVKYNRLPDALSPFRQSHVELIEGFEGKLAIDKEISIRLRCKLPEIYSGVVLRVENKNNIPFQEVETDVYSCSFNFDQCNCPSVSVSFCYASSSSSTRALEYSFDVDPQSIKETAHQSTGFQYIKSIAPNDYEIDVKKSQLKFFVEKVSDGVSLTAKMDPESSLGNREFYFRNYVKKNCEELLVKFLKKGEKVLSIYAGSEGSSSLSQALEYKINVTKDFPKAKGFPEVYSLFKRKKFSLVKPMSGFLKRARKKPIEFEIRAHADQCDEIEKLTLWPNTGDTEDFKKEDLIFRAELSVEKLKLMKNVVVSLVEKKEPEKYKSLLKFQVI